MEFSYTQIKQMDVVSVSDGRHLGKVCDLLFEFPEGRVRGFYVTGGKGFRFTRQEVFIPLSSVVRIGEDVIITDIDCCLPPKDKCRRGDVKCHPHCDQPVPPRERRSFEEYE